MILSARDHAVVETVNRFRQVSSRQIERLHFSEPDTSPRSRGIRTRRTLARLTKGGYIGRLERSTGGASGGSEGYVYVPRGARVRDLDRHALDVTEIYVRLVESGAMIKDFTIEDNETGLKPDAYAWIDDCDYFIEVDRATEWKPQLKRQIGAYSKAYLKATGSFPKVVWVVTFAPKNKVSERIEFIGSITRAQPVPELFDVISMQEVVKTCG